MDFSALIDWVRDAFAAYPVVCYGLGGGLLLLLFWKPAKTLKFLALFVIVLALLYGALVLTDSITSGVKVKEGGLQKMQKALE